MARDDRTFGLPIPHESPPEYNLAPKHEPAESTNLVGRPRSQLDDELRTSGRQRNRETSPPEYASVPSHDNSKEARQAGFTWRSSYLCRRVLLGFIAFFLAVLVTLEIIYQVSEQRQGLAMTRESWHYLWKFGPTAGKPLCWALC